MVLNIIIYYIIKREYNWRQNFCSEQWAWFACFYPPPNIYIEIQVAALLKWGRNMICKNSATRAAPEVHLALRAAYKPYNTCNTNNTKLQCRHNTKMQHAVNALGYCTLKKYCAPCKLRCIHFRRLDIGQQVRTPLLTIWSAFTHSLLWLFIFCGKWYI